MKNDEIAEAALPRFIDLLEKDGVEIGELSEEEMNRVMALILEEGRNILGKAELANRRLRGQSQATKVEATTALVVQACEIAAKRFLAGRNPRHGP